MLSLQHTARLIGNMSPVLSQLAAIRIKPILCDSTRRGLWKLPPGFPQASPYAPFPSAAFALYLFAEISHTCEYNYTLSPLDPPSKSLNLGVGLGTCHTQKIKN